EVSEYVMRTRDCHAVKVRWGRPPSRCRPEATWLHGNGKAKARRATGLRVARLTCGVRSGIRCRHLRNAFADVLRTRGLICNNLRVNADTQKCGLDPDSQFVELAVEVFGLLADATRVRIIL